MKTTAVVAPVKDIGTERYISPARASQILSHTLGHGYSRQSIVRLLEAGALAGHQMKSRGRWWILSRSLHVYVESVLGRQAWGLNSFGDVNQVARTDSPTRRPM